MQWHSPIQVVWRELQETFCTNLVTHIICVLLYDLYTQSLSDLPSSGVAICTGAEKGPTAIVSAATAQEYEVNGWRL